jgi:hypothetical protein
VELNLYSPYVPSWLGQRKLYLLHATRPDAIHINVFWLEYRHVEWVCHANRNAAYIDQVVPLQALCGPEGSRRFRLPDFHGIRHMKVVRSSASRTGRLYPQECSLYSFSPGAEPTPRPWCGRKDIDQTTLYIQGLRKAEKVMVDKPKVQTNWKA